MCRRPPTLAGRGRQVRHRGAAARRCPRRAGCGRPDFPPGPTLAFGRSDRHQFAAAQSAARTHGLTPVVRVAGGHAAAYDRGCVLAEVVSPPASTLHGAEERYERLSELITMVMADCAVEVVLGEYCPGRFSLHLPSGPKVAGIAQRVIRGAALTTAVIAVDGAAAQRSALTDVYAALELALEPPTIGAVTDAHPSVGPEAIARALRLRAQTVEW